MDLISNPQLPALVLLATAGLVPTGTGASPPPPPPLAPVVPPTVVSGPVLAAVVVVVLAAIGSGFAAFALFGTNGLALTGALFGFLATPLSFLYGIARVERVQAAVQVTVLQAKQEAAVQSQTVVEEVQALKTKVDGSLSLLVPFIERAGNAEGQIAGANLERQSAAVALLELATAKAKLAEQEITLATLRAALPPPEPQAVVVISSPDSPPVRVVGVPTAQEGES